MLCIATGTPGAGKTINMIEYVSEDTQFMGRPVFYIGINECKVEGWTQLTTEQFEKWYEFLPEHSVLFVDECQEYWRSGTKGTDLPLHLTKLERHRHRGIDVVATCQHMFQLHRMVKVLIDQHRHYSRPHGREKWQCLTYTEFKDNPASETHAKHAIKSSGKYNPKYFDAYKSSSNHTYRNRFPKKYLYLAAGVAVAAVGLISYAVYHLKSGTEKTYFDDEQTVKAEQGTSYGFQKVLGSNSQDEYTQDEVIRLLTPLIENRPDTAPIFMEKFSDVRDYPREQPIMFTSGPKKGMCRVYSQQATRMRLIDAQTCIHIINEGRSFDHRIEPNGNANGLGGERHATKPPSTFSYPFEPPKPEHDFTKSLPSVRDAVAYKR